MTLANFNSNFNWQLRALQKAAGCCGIVPNLPPGPPSSEKCWCATFTYTKAGVSPLDIKNISINGQPPIVSAWVDLFDPAFPAAFATYLNGLFPDLDIEVAVMQIRYQDFIICIKNLDDPYTFDTMLLGGLIGTINFTQSVSCPAVNRGPLSITFNSDSELIATYALDPAIALTYEWNQLLGIDGFANPATYTYSTWDPGSLTVTLYGAANLLTFQAKFFGFTTIVSVADNGGYYDVLDASCFASSSLTYAYFSDVTNVQNTAFSFITFGPLTVNLPSATYIGPNAFDTTNGGLLTVNIPVVTAIDYAAFVYSAIQVLNAPLCINVGPYAFSSSSIFILNLPACTDLGGSPGDDSVFFGIFPAGFGTFSFNNVLSTINAGLPDGDIDYVTTNYPGTITVTYV